MHGEVEINGEYWIQNGSVDYADGDIGDQNHESIAIQSVVHQYADEIADLAEEQGLGENIRRNFGWDDLDSEAVARVLGEIVEKIAEEKNISEKEADAEVMQHLGCNRDAYMILQGGGDARLYCMVYENWIAVRGHNIELYGYDETKRRYLQSGIGDILESEGVDDDVPPEEIEFTLYDHKTKRSSYVSLADIENPAPVMRTSQPLMSVKKVTPPKDSEENKYQQPSVSVKNKWTKAAQDQGVIPPGHDLWRGTSEGWMPFSKWVVLREAKK